MLFYVCGALAGLFTGVLNILFFCRKNGWELAFTCWCGTPYL